MSQLTKTGRIFDDGPAPARRMVRADDHDGVTLTFDRRRTPRRTVCGGAMAVFASGHGAGTVARVELVDASWNGLGLVSPVAVEPGASVSVLPEHAMSPRQTGIVVRCDKTDTGYRLGLQCRIQRAAA